MMFSCKQRKAGTPFLFSAAVVAFCITGCQKELQDPSGPIEDTAVWVLKTKQVQGFTTSMGHMAYLMNAAYYYDTAARTIIYRDTTDNQSTSEYQYFYDASGRLIRTIASHNGAEYERADIGYNSDSLVQKIAYISAGIAHEGTFQWSRQGTDYLGQYTDPFITTTPYSEGKRTMTLNSKRQLMEDVYLSTNSTVHQIEEVQRDDQGSVTIAKLYYTLGNTKVLRDSVIYTRDNVLPSRLSAFHSLWGKGIEWYSNGYFISFLVPPVWDTEYHDYSNTLTRKKEHFTIGTDPNGNIGMVPAYTEEFHTDYDTDKNPVKQTIYIDGEKCAEIAFTWQKIHWIK